MKFAKLLAAASLGAMGLAAVPALAQDDDYIYCAIVVNDGDYSHPAPVYISQVFQADYASFAEEKRSLQRAIMRRDGHEMYQMEQFCFYEATREEAEDGREEMVRDYEDRDRDLYRVMRWAPRP